MAEMSTPEDETLPPIATYDEDEASPSRPRQSLRRRADQARRLRSRTLVCVLEDPDDFRNVCAVIRNIDALGVTKLYIVDSQNNLPSTWEKMKSHRTWMAISASAVKWVYIRKFATTAECFEHLAKEKYVNVATSPHQHGRVNINLYDANFRQKHLAIWFGNEARGLSASAIEQCDFCLQIPMCGIIESLNLAVCSGIVLSFIQHQRRGNTSTRAKSRTRSPMILSDLPEPNILSS